MIKGIIMANIRTLVENFTKTPLFKSTANKLSKFDQAVLLGPACLVADIISRNIELSQLKELNVCWLAPSGNELIDKCAWFGLVGSLLESDLKLNLTFIGNQALGDINGPNPKVASQLSLPNVTIINSDVLPSNIDTDILILGHSHDAIGFDSWKVDALNSASYKVAVGLTYSASDQIVEAEKWNSLGIELIASINPEYSFNSKSEEGSRWAYQVDYLKYATLTDYLEPSISAWVQKHSGDSGVLNPLFEPCKPIDQITPFKGGQSINGVYLIDYLVIIPDFHLLVELDPKTSQLTLISAVSVEMIKDLPSVESSYFDRYTYAQNVKLSLTKMTFESDTHLFVKYLESKLQENEISLPELRQLILHESDLGKQIPLLRKAIGHNCADSLLDLAQIKREHFDDSDEPLRMLKVASSIGHAVADFNLSVFAQEDPSLFSGNDALKFLSRSAALGLPQANYFLGMYYINEHHTKWGIDHLEKAALFGLQEAVEYILNVKKEQLLTNQITKKQYSLEKRKYRQFQGVV
jgi:hypothetical protein